LQLWGNKRRSSAKNSSQGLAWSWSSRHTLALILSEVVVVMVMQLSVGNMLLGVWWHVVGRMD